MTDAEQQAASDGRTVDEPTGSSTDASILELRDLEKHFGGITAVDGASFRVERGTITGLIGPNGAGKSTTFNCVTGVHAPDAGSVVFDGEEITGLEPYQVANRGLVRTFQITREFPEMTVLENMMLAPKNQLGESLWRSVTPIVRGGVVDQEVEILERAWETLEFFEIDHLANEYAGTLSGGQRKLLELARALLTGPEMLLLDEPMAGVNPSLEKKLLERVHELKDQGYTFLLVEHDMDVIMNHCDHVIVMHRGSVLAEGAAAEIQSNEAVVEAYLGGEV
ncbi:ABC transporter ATP-binding protein [Natrinema sp. 1APR25-10V2]|uniref:ABC transporter ATP-binding protein n=1 Tax=Natrinema sp. 1APR25-10V2 TaxID=2951081 RepID=UPI00287578C4|nr:ABC transporter ATP-binding protein [Natrinema sp. 1APR25-10V2]MDS0477485.1 ABC transporter ATP-binding protein [Natrinema sp. 1APR25-10V2]